MECWAGPLMWWLELSLFHILYRNYIDYMLNFPVSVAIFFPFEQSIMINMWSLHFQGWHFFSFLFLHPSVVFNVTTQLLHVCVIWKQTDHIRIVGFFRFDNQMFTLQSAVKSDYFSIGSFENVSCTLYAVCHAMWRIFKWFYGRCSIVKIRFYSLKTSCNVFIWYIAISCRMLRLGDVMFRHFYVHTLVMYQCDISAYCLIISKRSLIRRFDVFVLSERTPTFTFIKNCQKHLFVYCSFTRCNELQCKKSCFKKKVHLLTFRHI